MNQKNRNSAPWITIYDRFGDPSNALLGNEIGLRKLQTKIGEALENGRSALDGAVRADFTEIRIEDHYPELEPESAKDQVLKVLLLALLTSAVGIFLFGFYSLFRLF